MGPDSTGGLSGLSQGDRTVSDFVLEFRTRASISNWNVVVQCNACFRP